MGNVSIIARRLSDGQHVQYGWSGNGGYYRNIGSRILNWYNDPDRIDYLFSLGQFRLLGKPGSEYGGYPTYLSTLSTGEPHWMGNTERDIFSQIAFVDHGYFFDLDNMWYYIIPGPFRIKVPLEYIAENCDDNGYEFETLQKIEMCIMQYILLEYSKKDDAFASLIVGYMLTPAEILQSLGPYHPVLDFYNKYRDLWQYFDDWVVIKTKDDFSGIQDILVRKKSADEDVRPETITWK